MKKIDGNISRTGSIAFIAQQAWIQNLSLRDNILFGKDFVPEKYEKIVEGCSLKKDLEILVNGDETEIGENGINLSGGQKQRINLARAVYSDADIYLLDDPLSAVDAHVGKHIFENIISSQNEQSLLRNKTRLWVTNNLSFLPNVDHIIVLENGSILDQGNYKDLVEKNIFSHLKVLDSTSNKSDTEPKSEGFKKLETDENLNEKPNQDLDDSKEKKGQLIKAEAVETGQVKLKV